MDSVGRGNLAERGVVGRVTVLGGRISGSGRDEELNRASNILDSVKPGFATACAPLILTLEEFGDEVRGL